MKRVNGHHRQNDTSVLELDTPIQNYKDTYGQEAYEQATSFYESEEWKKVERDQLNSDRRYYENRKACSLEEYNEWESAEARKHRFQDTPSVVLSAERKVTNGFDDLFDDPVLREAMEVLTEKQYSALYCSFKSRLDTYEIAERMGTTVRAVQDLRRRALDKLRDEYISLYDEAKAFGYPGLVSYNYKRILVLFEQCKIIFMQKESPETAIPNGSSNKDPAA